MSRVEPAACTASQGSGRGVISRALTQLPSGSWAERSKVCMCRIRSSAWASSSGLSWSRSRGGSSTSSRRAPRASRSATPFSSAWSRSRAAMRVAGLGRNRAFGADREAPAPAALGEQSGAPRRRRRREPLQQGDEARHGRRLDLIMARPLPLREQHAEIDRLRGQQGGRHDQGDLSDQAPRQEPFHEAALTGASLPPRACSRRPRRS